MSDAEKQERFDQVVFNYKEMNSAGNISELGKERNDVVQGRRETYIPTAKKTSLTERFPRSIAPSLRIGNQTDTRPNRRHRNYPRKISFRRSRQPLATNHGEILISQLS